ncbi:MAG: tetratricopeptide repeat protein, partial [Candidatus Vecturithrix sp.]|nr:tetratricopeptide repeat protein [Candidatus Vecturithrix sp.]
LSSAEILESIYFPGRQVGFDGSLHRPIAMITFALNWYFSGDDVVGYHAINILIHFLTALTLYKTIRRLLQSKNLPFRNDEDIELIALTATVLWAAHPIQTQAVTYIVQRSTSLAALFCIAAIYLYISGRQSINRSQGVAAFFGCALCYILALATKLNSFLLPASLLLVEIIFFQDLSSKETIRRMVWVLLGASVLMVVGGALFLWAWRGNLIDYFTRAYQNRPFTLLERLLTEPRILLFYLSQIIWPLPGRFSLVHEVSISTSLLQPWTTLPSLLGLLSIGGVGLAAVRRWPFVSLAILFYLVNHLIESTFIPLELVFEHRNYLPSMFLFVPVAGAIQKAIAVLREHRPILSGIFVSGTILIFIVLGFATYTRNNLWIDNKIFWEDALIKAPNTARPYQELAAYYEARQNFPMALKLYNHSLNLYDPSPQRSRALALTNMGVLLQKIQQTESAIGHFQKALAIFPEHEIARYNLIFALLTQKIYPQALDHAEILLTYNPHHPYYLNTAGLIRMQMGYLEEAKVLLEKALAQKPDDVNALVNLGVTSGRLGQYRLAEQLLEKAIRFSPYNPTPRLCLIDLYLLSGQKTMAHDHARELVYEIPLGKIEGRLKTETTGLDLYDSGIIRSVISVALKDIKLVWISKKAS